MIDKIFLSALTLLSNVKTKRKIVLKFLWTSQNDL